MKNKKLKQQVYLSGLNESRNHYFEACSWSWNLENHHSNRKRGSTFKLTQV